MPRELLIKPVLNGWIIQCGCQTIVHNDPHVMIAEFSQWILDPAKLENKYEKLMVERGFMNPVPPAPEAMAQTAQEVPVPQSPNTARERVGDFASMAQPGR